MVTWRAEACEGYRLPTEAEWERAARFGQGEGSAIADSQGWHSQNSGGTTHLVGLRTPAEKEIGP